MPLTTITAWEALFDRFRLTPESPGTLSRWVPRAVSDR